MRPKKRPAAMARTAAVGRSSGIASESRHGLRDTERACEDEDVDLDDARTCKR